MPESIGRANEEERRLGRITRQIIAQEDTISGKHALRKLFEYDADGNVIYMGLNEQDKSINDSDWTVKKFFYDTDGNVIDIQVLTGSWSNRASLSWKSAGGD